MQKHETNCLSHYRTARQSHAGCAICGGDDPLCLGLEFQVGPDGGMFASIRDGSQFQGYPDRLHGGIISTLFDAAMTHCLFAHGLTGVTASLKVKFLEPVNANLPVVVHARIEKHKSHLYRLRGTLQQGGDTKSTAVAKFWIIPPAS